MRSSGRCTRTGLRAPGYDHPPVRRGWGVKTGAEYIESLGDGRATYYEGRRIDDLMVEPAFARPAEWVAEGYCRYYQRGEGAMIPMVLAPRSKEERQERGKEIIELDVALNVTYQSIMRLL